MALRLTYGLSVYIRAIKVLITRRVPRPSGIRTKLPRRGSVVYSCCTAGGNPKLVDHVDVWNDIMYYADGTNDSLYHCGWSYYPDHHTTKETT